MTAIPTKWYQFQILISQRKSFSNGNGISTEIHVGSWLRNLIIIIIIASLSQRTFLLAHCFDLAHLVTAETPKHQNTKTPSANHMWHPLPKPAIYSLFDQCTFPRFYRYIQFMNDNLLTSITIITIISIIVNGVQSRIEVGPEADVEDCVWQPITGRFWFLYWCWTVPLDAYRIVECCCTSQSIRRLNTG